MTTTTHDVTKYDRAMRRQKAIEALARLNEEQDRARVDLPTKIEVSKHFGEIVGDSLALKVPLARADAVAPAGENVSINESQRKLALENEYLHERESSTSGFGEIIGDSPALRQVLEQVELVAPTDASVIVLGESGTGKELIARALHDRSNRCHGPLIRVNCAAIPHELFESEFFGHVKGSFTGATRDRAGRFELANGGTLFLDEVGEIPLAMQSKLLRVLQEGAYERIGDEKTLSTDVRIVAATNRDLQSEVQAKRFRQDLYYRLSVFPIVVVPLRDRKDDIPKLVSHFLEQCSRKMGIETLKLKHRHIIELQHYGWPGNIRELQNVVERAVICSRSGSLEFRLPRPDADSEALSEFDAIGTRDLLTFDEFKILERKNLIAVLENANWKISGKGGAAEFLGVAPATLNSRMRAMKIERPK